VLADTNATQNDIDSALKNLNQAASDLTLNPAKPDKTKLQAAYDKNKTVTNPDDKYTSESWQAFQTALSDAQKVLADANATQDSLDTTLQKLNNAYAGLKLNSQKPDKSALQTAYDKDSTVTNQANKYTTASWTTFQSALANAKKVLADTDAVQADVDTALQKLNDAYDGLTLSPDKSALQTALTEAQTLSHSAVTGDHEGNYPADALKTLQVAIDTAKKVADNPDASKDDIDTAASTLKQAITAFKQTVVTVNRDQLTQLVTESQTLRADDYTQDSWTPYQQAVAAAQKLLAGKPSQQELDAAATALKKAKTSLVAAPTGKLPSTGDASSESASSSEETASSSTAKYPSTGESQLSLAVTMAAVVFLIGISGFAWFLHQKGKAK
ncbi:glycoside hydrolase, partial [Lacticaseibacillus rhamnosus]